LITLNNGLLPGAGDRWINLLAHSRQRDSQGSIFCIENTMNCTGSGSNLPQAAWIAMDQGPDPIFIPIFHNRFETPCTVDCAVTG